MIDEQERQARQWALILHLSQFAGYIIPLAGMIAPIAIWQIKKDELPGIDQHGRIVTNWIISVFIYSIVCTILTLVFIGIIGFIVLGVLVVLFPIIGAIKANDGVAWRYPLSIRIF
ncbi:MAG: DUF4870 domain-containing protein [Planctomycetota bacterium]